MIFTNSLKQVPTVELSVLLHARLVSPKVIGVLLLVVETKHLCEYFSNGR